MSDLRIKSKLESNSAVFERVNMSVTEHAFFNIWGLDYSEQKSTKSIFDLVTNLNYLFFHRTFVEF